MQQRPQGKTVRKAIIHMALKRQKPGSGSGTDFLRRRTTHMVFPNLQPVLGEIPFAFVGAAATRLYMPERVTNDLDILVCATHFPVAHDALMQSGFEYLGSLSIGGGQYATPTGFAVDVLASDTPWCQTAIAQAQTNRDAHGNPVLPLCYLVLMKYLASRFQDVADMGRVLAQATPEQIKETRDVFAQYLPGEEEDLNSLITLGRLEFDTA